MPSSTRLLFPALGRRWLFACLAACPVVALAQSPAVSTLVAFSGSQASSTPVRGPDGALYGTTATVNVVTGGLIYRLAANGSRIDTLYQLRLEDGYSPFGGVVLGSDDLLYGATSLGAATEARTSGTIYRLAPNGSDFTVLHRFEGYTELNTNGDPKSDDGTNPDSELVEGIVEELVEGSIEPVSDGFLYGVTRTGGEFGTGVVYRIEMDDDNTFEVLHEFDEITSAQGVARLTNEGGVAPIAPLVYYRFPEDSPVTPGSTYVYGTTSRGGETGSGTIFRVRVDGTGFDVLHTFPELGASGTTAATNSDGAVPLAGLTIDDDGWLYGVASAGGLDGNGTLFRIRVDGTGFLVLHHFDGDEGSQPSGELLLATDGRLYGTTASGGQNASGTATLFGTVFRVDRDGNGFEILHNFAGSDGANPSGKLLQLDDTTFVGITLTGGRCSQGTAFQLSLTGSTVNGVTNCGSRRDSGSGAVAPLLLLLMGVAAVARRRAAR